MKKLLIIFIILSTLSYGDVLNKVYEIAKGNKGLVSKERRVPYDNKLIDRLDFSDKRLKSRVEGMTVEEHIKDLKNPHYSRWAYEVEESIILSVSHGTRRQTTNYVFKKDGDGRYNYNGEYFYGDYTTGITIIESEGSLYILVYHVDEGNKEFVRGEVYNKDLQKIGEVKRRGVKYTLDGEELFLSRKEIDDMLADQERVVIGVDSYRDDTLDKQVFTLDYNNDGTLEDIYFNYYRSESYNTQDELRTEFSNEAVEKYFREALGRVVGMRVFEHRGKVYMAFLEREAFYGDRHYGNYIRIFLADGSEITEEARLTYKKEKEFEIERM